MSENTEGMPPAAPVRTSARTATTDRPGPVRGGAAQGSTSSVRSTGEPRSSSVSGTSPSSPAQSRPKPRPAAKPAGPRRVRLAVSRVDPWSAMKLAFLLSIAIGIGIVVATAVVWWVLNSMEVFASVRGILEDAEALDQFGSLLEYVEFSRVISVATVIAVVDVVLLTALATLGAFVYNIVAAMVGGLHLTLTDD